jgi:hypothetical protein
MAAALALLAAMGASLAAAPGAGDSKSAPPAKDTKTDTPGTDTKPPAGEDDAAVSLGVPPGFVLINGAYLPETARGNAEWTEAFTLPPPKADGSFGQDEIVARQRKRAALLSKKLFAPFSLTETAHFLILSETDAATTAAFAKWSEPLFASLCAQFSLDRKERVWSGKCCLMLFKTQTQFRNYARIFDGASPSSGAMAYFRWERMVPSANPQLVHICMPVTDRGVGINQEIFAHETTHAFLQMYRRPAPVPRWLHEGLAVYMTVVNDPSLRQEHWRQAQDWARRGGTVDEMLGQARGVFFPEFDYSVVYSVVDCLLKGGGARFKQFVCLLKDGKDQDTALRTAYGFDTAGLASRWNIYMASPGSK